MCPIPKHFALDGRNAAWCLMAVLLRSLVQVLLQLDATPAAAAAAQCPHDFVWSNFCWHQVNNLRQRWWWRRRRRAWWGWLRVADEAEVGEVHTAQLCPLHLTPDWRSSCWRSFIATRFCLLHWKLFEILRRFVRKADSFQRALQLSPQAFRGGEHKSQMHLHCTPHPPPLSPVPPLCLLHLLRESFFNTSCIADIMKWPPDRPTDGSLPQSPLIFPSTSLSLTSSVSLSWLHFACI